MEEQSNAQGSAAIRVRPTLRKERSPLAAPARQLELLGEVDLSGAPGEGDFDALTSDALGDPLRASGVDVLQLNLGARCNQTCVHCHVDAGPDRTEDMSREVADRCLEVLAATDIPTVDITGGAPEMAAQFRHLVRGARALGRHVMDRCNLTILSEPGQEDLAAFLANQGVHVISSLPCYLESNVDRQRGTGVFDRSIAGLKQLNALGYGRDAGLRLDLVYNPVGASLPPPQADLERDYREALAKDFGIRFDALLTITNMPIKRFAHALAREGRDQEYMDLLIANFNAETVSGLMCRHQLSVDHRGRLYDCDFNQQLALTCGDGGPRHLRDLLNTTNDISSVPIRTGRHCFACTAGAGSSCGGALQG